MISIPLGRRVHDCVDDLRLTVLREIGDDGVAADREGVARLAHSHIGCLERLELDAARGQEIGGVRQQRLDVLIAQGVLERDRVDVVLAGLRQGHRDVAAPDAGQRLELRLHARRPLADADVGGGLAVEAQRVGAAEGVVDVDLLHFVVAAVPFRHRFDPDAAVHDHAEAAHHADFDRIGEPEPRLAEGGEVPDVPPARIGRILEHERVLPRAAQEDERSHPERAVETRAGLAHDVVHRAADARAAAHGEEVVAAAAVHAHGDGLGRALDVERVAAALTEDLDLEHVASGIG